VLLAVAAALALRLPTRAGLAQATLTLVVFLASVPLGALARDPQSRSAWGRLVLLGGLGLLVAGLGWSGSAPATFLRLLPPLLPAGALGLLLRRGREHTPTGEQLASLAFALAAHPIATFSGAPGAQAGSLAGLLAAAFLLSALSVRTLQRRPVPGLGRPWTLLPPLLGLGLCAVLEHLYQSHMVGARLTWVLLPSVAATLSFAFHRPARFKVVGWILAAGTFGTATLSVLLLR